MGLLTAREFSAVAEIRLSSYTHNEIPVGELSRGVGKCGVSLRLITNNVIFHDTAI